MHTTNLSSGLSSSVNRSKNYKSNSHFNNVNNNINSNKSNGNGNYSAMNREPLNSTPAYNGAINLGAQLITSQLKGNPSATNDLKDSSDLLNNNGISKIHSSSNAGGLSSTGTIYLQKPHHQLPAASTSYFHTNLPSSQPVNPSTYKQHRSRYTSPLLNHFDEQNNKNNNNSLNNINSYITSPTRSNSIYSSNSNIAPTRNHSASKYYGTNLGILNGSTTNSSGSPNSSASASPNVTSISYPQASPNVLTVPVTNTTNNGGLKKASSLRHTNIRSPIQINGSNTISTASNVGFGSSLQQAASQQHSPTSAFKSTSLINKPNSNQFNSNYLIKKKVLSTSPVPNLNSVSFINTNSSGSTLNLNGLGSSNGFSGSSTSLSNTTGTSSPYTSLSSKPSSSSARSTHRSRSNKQTNQNPAFSNSKTSLVSSNQNSSEPSTNGVSRHRNTISSTADLKKTLQNIELKMRIIASPNIRIADLFKCFLKNVPKSTETIEFLYSNFYDQLSKINPTTNNGNTSSTNKFSSSNAATSNKHNISKSNQETIKSNKSSIKISQSSSIKQKENAHTETNTTAASNTATTELPSVSLLLPNITLKALDLDHQGLIFIDEMPDSLIMDSQTKSNYDRAYSLSSPSNSSVSSNSNSSSYPTPYLNLSAPSYFSKGHLAKQLPPKEEPLNISKPKKTTTRIPPPKPNLNRSNTLSPKTLSRRLSLTSATQGPGKNIGPGLSKVHESKPSLNKTNSFTDKKNPFRANLNSNPDLNSLNNSFQSLVHYGDNIGAKVVKCLINENLYESQSLINQDYDIYQGPALCVTYDSILKDEHWDEIFICQDEETNFSSTTKPSNGSSKTHTKPFIGSKFSASITTDGTTNGATTNQGTHASKFISFFHISDFIAILSGYKVAFVDPYERFNNDERSYVAIFDLENDIQDIEQFEDQFKPLEKIFNVPLLKNRYYNGTIIRLPLRTQSSTCSVSNKLVHVKDILINAKDFMKEAHLHILFAKNVSNIQFCRTKDSQNIEKIYSINVEDSCMEQFRSKYKKINDAILEGDFPRTSTVIITLRKQIETKIEKTEWILSIFADTMRLLNSNYFLMKLAIPISENFEKDFRFSHKSNLISSDTGFIKTFFLTKPIICYIEDKEGILMSHFCRLNISDSLKLSHFNDAYALMLKDLTKINRKDSTLIWSLMPDLEKNTEFTELLGEIWQELAKHELFYSCTEGWGYVAIEDMIINDVEDKSILQEILTKIYSESNYPVVIMPPNVLKALQKYSPKDSLQIMTPSQTSDILHSNTNLTESLSQDQRIELLRYLIKEPNQVSTVTSPEQQAVAPLSTSSSNWPSSAARYILDLPLLMLSNQKFIRFQAPNKAKSVYICEKDYISLFSIDALQESQFISPELPQDLMEILKKFEFQRLTQAQMISDSELSELISVPKEWRSGDERIVWPKTHDKFNIDWLENLWKYLSEYCKTDLTMMENFNIIYTLQSNKQLKIQPSPSSLTSSKSKEENTKNLVLFKLSKNSNLVYTPPYNSEHSTDATTIGAILLNSLNETNSHNHNNNLLASSADHSQSTISEETYVLLIKILTKLGFQCIESISPTILNHPLFQNYVPNIRRSRFNLLRALRNKYKHASLVKTTLDFNALLNEADIKLLQIYLSRTEQVTKLTSNQAAFSSALNSNNPQAKLATNKDLVEEEQGLVELLKELPIFENSALECTDKYLPLKDCWLIYDNPNRLPFELPGIKPFISIQNNESRIIVQDKLNYKLVKDFTFIIKEVIRYCSSKELNTLSTQRVHTIGKWLLLNCSSYFLNYDSTNKQPQQPATSKLAPNSGDLMEMIRNAKLFLNQNKELCSASQFINPVFKERYLPILDVKWLPARDLIADEKCLNVLKELKMRNCFQLKVDEITELYEFSMKQTDVYRRLLAELIVETLITRLKENTTNTPGSLDSVASIEKILNEYSTTKAVTLRHFLMSVNWIPLQRERPQSYPQSLLWKGSELSSAASPSTNLNHNIRFSSPRDCVDSQFAYCTGSVSCVSDLEIPAELKVYVDLKQVQLDLVVRHLKITTKCFESAAVKAEWYDYLTVTKRCYEFMSTCDPQDIFRELKANDLNEWIWNGAGFSSIQSIFLITEKDHPLCSHVAILPYELYVFVKFFEKLGIKKLPDSKQLESILANCAKKTITKATPVSSPTKSDGQAYLENAAKNFPLINWIKAYYSSDKKLQTIVKDYEDNLSTSGYTNGASPFVASPASNSSTNSSPNKFFPLQTNLIDSMNAEALSDFIYLYLPEIYKGAEIKDNLINSLMTLVKNRQIKILDEEAYLMRKVAVAAATAVAASSAGGSPNGKNPQVYNIYDHYRVYNEIILPNLNNLSKTVKDSVVLFALDHADPKMLEILRDHPCIPVSPFGRRLKKPNKLVHPGGKTAALYSDSDERFPYGSEETYLREDRLQILKILGMKCDLLSWQELIERAESITKIREYDVAIERSIVILNILNEKLNISNSTSANSAKSPSNAENNTNSTVSEDREAKNAACELIRDIAFIPVKPKPYQKLTLAWYGDKFKFRFAKPKELLSGVFEPLCSSLWPIPLYEYKRKERIITKQIEHFLGIDDITGKLTLKDALAQLDEVAKTNLQEIDDSKEVKIVTDMCFQLYEYIQLECQKKPAELVPIVREFFGDRPCILLNEEFISVNQLCWHLNVNLKSMFYQIPTTFLRSLKYLFNQVLMVKVNLDLPDLLHVVDTIRKKYKDAPILNRDDFNILMNVYSLMIDQGYQIITNLYLPNINQILVPGRLLFFHPLNADQIDKADDYVHPAVDRRICIIAGCTMNKKLLNQEASPTVVNSLTLTNNQNGRVFPRVFGNKRLEGILARLDDDKIDLNLVNNIDEGNPQILLEYLLEANRIHSLSAFLSEDDIFVILKYFNDFLARNYQAGTFQRLKELKIFKPLWSEKYINLNLPVGPPPVTPPPTTTNGSSLNLNLSVANIYLITDEMAALMKRSFKLNPFKPTSNGLPGSTATVNGIGGSTGSVNGTGNDGQSVSSLTRQNSEVGQPHTILVRRSELAKLYAHLGLTSLNDLEAFINLCLPQFRKLDAKCQNNFLKYLYEEILEKSYMHEKEKCFKILREKLYIQTRKGEQQLISDLYDMKSESLKHILSDNYFPDENFDSPQCLRFLKEAGLRTYLPSDLCKKCMNEIESIVSNDPPTSTSASHTGWTDELRTRSKWIYQHLVDNWQRFDDSVLQQRFLEPYCPADRYLDLKHPFEYSEFKHTCLKLSDAELQKYEMLVWSSSFILPQFVQVDSIDANGVEFLKLNRKPCFAIVNQHLNNICESAGRRKIEPADIKSHDDSIIEILGRIYQYLDDLHINEHHKDMYKQLEDKEIVWSASTRKFVSPNKICIELDIVDEIPPFLYSLTPSLKNFKSLLMRLGAKEKPYPMLYGDILRKMAKVCGDDYLNSNELCKALKAMECFFKNLKTSSNATNKSTDNVSSQFKLPGLYFVTTELKLEKSSNVVILDNRDNLDDLAKLTTDKFIFNPSEKVLKMSTSEIKPLIDKIFISQRPTLFSQKYEATYDYTLPDDPDSQRQNLLTSLERKYQQIFTSRQLHRCLARCISNEEARRSSPKHLPIDEVEKVIRERLSSIKVTCVEYLETSLSYRKLSQQQKLEQTVEEKAVYLTHESLQFATLYVSKKHIEQPYFALCISRALQPLLVDLHFDHSIFTSLIATSVSQMSRLLQLVNVATEENILSVIKLQYVPSSGKLYGDDINLLAQYDTKLHNVLIGDLCVFSNVDGTYIYCQIIKITAIDLSEQLPRSKYSKKLPQESTCLEYEFTVQLDDAGLQTCVIGQKDLYVLENWHRIYDAMDAKPPDERETFKYQETGSSTPKSNGTDDSKTNGSGKREDSEEASNNSDSSDKSDTSSTYGSNENIPNGIELEQSKSEVNNELRLLWGLEENERKKKINRLLLKWHPDKNPGKESFASEVFKHLKKQIELYKTDPFLAGFYKSSYSSNYSGFGTGSTAGSGTGSTTGGYGSSTGTSDYKPYDYKSSFDDYKSRHYGSFDDLHGRKGSPGGGSPHSSPNRESARGSPGTGFGDYDAKGPGPSNLGRTGSFRQEWERRRQQKRQTAGADPSERSSPSSARRRGTDFTQMDAGLWITQAKSDLDAANNDMHPITGKPAYEWVCYKCYRAVEKALRAYHYFKGNGKLPASDIHGLLLGVETNIRDIAFRFCNFIGNEANSMQFPGIARFGKTPNEVFPLTKAEQALDYGKELLKLVEEVIYAN